MTHIKDSTNNNILSDSYIQELKIEEDYIESFENVIHKIFTKLFYSFISGIGLGLGIIFIVKLLQSFSIYIWTIPLIY